MRRTVATLADAWPLFTSSRLLCRSDIWVEVTCSSAVRPAALSGSKLCASMRPSRRLRLGRFVHPLSICSERKTERTRHQHVRIFDKIRLWSRRRNFREGRTLSRFIARDVRREVLIVSAARIEEGIITGRVRTTNVLYLSKGLVPQPEFEPPKELRIKEMWDWTGKSWGGLPDGTSIVDHLGGGQSK